MGLASGFRKERPSLNCGNRTPDLGTLRAAIHRHSTGPASVSAPCSPAFRVSAEVNHRTSHPDAVSSDTKAAILDYCVFTQLVCPLPPSHSLTFPPALPSSPGKRGPLRCHGDEKGCSAGGGSEVDSCRGNVTSRRPLPRRAKLRSHDGCCSVRRGVWLHPVLTGFWVTVDFLPQQPRPEENLPKPRNPNSLFLVDQRFTYRGRLRS